MHLYCTLQAEHLNDQSHIVGAEMSVHDFNYCEESEYEPVLSSSMMGGYHPLAYSDSHDRGDDDGLVQHAAARWIDECASSAGAASHGLGLKLRVSNKQIVRLVVHGCLDNN